MFGKISNVNKITKRAKVESEGNNYFFDLKIWHGNLDILKKGLEVEFEIEKGRVVTIKELLSDARKKEAENEIKATINPQECINRYFGDTEATIESLNIDDADPKNGIDFLKMKRFMITAYNDLFELDSALVDKELDEAKHELTTLNKEYDVFRRKIKYPIKYAFEKIFLNSQPDYLKAQDDLEHITSQIRIYSQRERPLGRRLKEKEEQLDKITNKNSNEYRKQEQLVKDLRKRYVDIIHYISQQKEMHIKLKDRIEGFKDAHFREFVTVYEPLSKYLEKKLIKILNAKAYKFDTLLWNRAKLSKIIRQFFMDSGIEGTYNSKTFLKYYLRTLDKDKLTTENRELFELLHYLESISKKDVLIIKNNIESAQRLKYLIENLDRDIRVTATFDPLETLKTSLSNIPDVILLDYNIRTTNAFDYIRKYREICQGNKKKTIFGLFIKESSPEFLKEIRKMKIDYLLDINATDQEFVDKIREIL